MGAKTPYLLMSLTLAGGVFVPLGQAFAANKNLSLIYDTEIIQACQTTLESDPITFRKQLEAYIYQLLLNDINSNIPKLVTNYWYLYRVEEIYDQLVKEYLEKERNNSSLWTRVKGSFLPGTAKEIGERVAKKVFNDPRMQAALNNVIQATAQDILERVKEKLITMQDFTAVCIEEAVGDKVNPALLKLFEQTLESGAREGITNLQLSGVGGSYIPYGTAAGIALVVLRKQILKTVERQLARKILVRISGQVVKRVVSKLIPFIGILLTAWDVKNVVSGDALFEPLQEALTSQEIKDTIRKEIIAALKEEMTKEAKTLAHDISKNIYIALKVTIEKLTKYNELLNEDPLLLQVFENLVQHGKTQEALKLLDLALYVKKLGIYDQLESILAQPQKLETILKIYPTFLPILKYTKSFEDVYLWYQLVDEDPEKFKKVVDLELYKYLDPRKLNKQTVNYLLQFTNFATVKLLLENVPTEELKNLTAIPPYKLEKFIDNYGIKGLQCLTHYAKIKPRLATRIVELSEKDPKAVYFFCQTQVKEYIAQYPALFDEVVEIYEAQKNFLGKVFLILETVIGLKSDDTIKLVNSKLYYLIWVLRIAVGLILIGFVLKGFRFIKNLKKKESNTSSSKGSQSSYSESDTDSGN